MPYLVAEVVIPVRLQILATGGLGHRMIAWCLAEDSTLVLALVSFIYGTLPPTLASIPLEYVLRALELAREQSTLPTQPTCRATLNDLLTELSPAEKERAARSTLTFDEARRILDRAGGHPLSELVLEMLSPKV